MSAFFKKNFTYLFILDSGEGREKEREKHQYVVASCMLPTGDLARNPGICPNCKLNQWPFGPLACAQSTEPHQPGLLFKIVKSKEWVNHSLLKQKLIVGYLGKFLSIINNLAMYILIKRTSYPFIYWLNKYFLSLLCARHVLGCENVTVTDKNLFPYGHCVSTF